MATYANTSKTNELIYPELSYKITGICFRVHNKMGRFCREKQYADALENEFKAQSLKYRREYRSTDSGNIIDFIVDGKIVLELKAKPVITKQDYFQIQRYLQDSGLKLGLLINFQNHHLKPLRVIKVNKQRDSKQ